VRHCIGSSSEIAEAAVQPGSSEDLSKIVRWSSISIFPLHADSLDQMKVLAEHKIPFAVRVFSLVLVRI
jgi:hypothetical protein